MKVLSDVIGALKRMPLVRDFVKRSAIDPTKPIAAQVSVSRKTRRKMLRRLAAERRFNTHQLTRQVRKLTRLSRKRTYLTRGFTSARSKRVLVGSLVERRLVTFSAIRGKVIRTVKFKVMKHGKLVAA